MRSGQTLAVGDSEDTFWSIYKGRIGQIGRNIDIRPIPGRIGQNSNFGRKHSYDHINHMGGRYTRILWATEVIFPYFHFEPKLSTLKIFHIFTF